MAGTLFTCEGLVLGRQETGEHHWRLDVFSPEDGAVRALARRASAKRPQLTPPDLFDRVVLELEKSTRGGGSFIKEAQVESPYAAIGRDYPVLLEASGFAATIWKNLSHTESFGELYELVERALGAFARGLRPEVTHFKSLYLFARTEGYPVKEQMLTSWSPSDRSLAQRILTEPLDGNQPSAEEVRQLLERLQHYLRAYTDILV